MGHIGRPCLRRSPTTCETFRRHCRKGILYALTYCEKKLLYDRYTRVCCILELFASPWITGGRVARETRLLLALLGRWEVAQWQKKLPKPLHWLAPPNPLLFNNRLYVLYFRTWSIQLNRTGENRSHRNFNFKRPYLWTSRSTWKVEVIWPHLYVNFGSRYVVPKFFTVHLLPHEKSLWQQFVWT